MTIHITPQQEFSYVSFETNVPQSSYKELVTKVLKTFQPEKCVITMFTNEVYKIIKKINDFLTNTINYISCLKIEITQ
jgi:S-adenosylmethionine decarboxylase